MIAEDTLRHPSASYEPLVHDRAMPKHEETEKGFESWGVTRTRSLGGPDILVYHERLPSRAIP